MKTLYLSKIIAISILLTGGLVSGQDKMVILPFHSIGVDQISIQTAESLLKQEIEKLSAVQIVHEKQTLELVSEEPCNEVTCAAEIGAKLNADQVVFGSLNKLGEKIIVQYTLVDVATKEVLVKDNATSTTVEDLDTVMKRVAMSVVKQEPIEKTIEVGAITEKESEAPPKQRKANTLAGCSIGYLFPQEGYGKEDRYFALDSRVSFELSRLQIGGQFSVRQGIAMNISGSYLFTKTDFCPYVGGAFGFHWISHHLDDDYSSKEENKREDGFELVANAGIMAFRTYNFRVLLNLDYSYTFNDYNDQAIALTIGLLFPNVSFSWLRFGTMGCLF